MKRHRALQDAMTVTHLIVVVLAQACAHPSKDGGAG